MTNWFDRNLIPDFDGSDSEQSMVKWIEKGVLGEKYQVCNYDAFNGWCIHSILAAEWKKENNFGCIMEALYTAFVADSFAA